MEHLNVKTEKICNNPHFSSSIIYCILVCLCHYLPNVFEYGVSLDDILHDFILYANFEK